jgi:4'-phosphopantetheinyl transferase EntD
MAAPSFFFKDSETGIDGETVIEAILPSSVAVATADRDPCDVMLFPEEQAAIGNVEPVRYREFATARWCARRALAQLDVAPAPIVPGEHGAPTWPVGIVGSMTHCTGYRAAAVAKSLEFRTLGIDTEVHEPIPGAVLRTIARHEELVALKSLRSLDSNVCWDRLLFSAKESVYKAWFPIAKRWLGFEDALISISSNGTFAARLLPADSPFDYFIGKWTAVDGLVSTAVVVDGPRVRQAS